MVRDFIRASLYDPASGYFASRPASVGTLPSPLDFRSMRGLGEYQKSLAGHYARLGCAWLTPSELFQPMYGAALAAYVLKAAEEDGSLQGGLRVIEVGPGTGTAARDFMLHVRGAAPGVFGSMTYTLVRRGDREE